MSKGESLMKKAFLMSAVVLLVAASFSFAESIFCGAQCEKVGDESYCFCDAPLTKGCFEEHSPSISYCISGSYEQCRDPEPIW
jgi:hypothetical protein